MSTRALPTTGIENFFDVNELIVSKTDLKGRITYANSVFYRVAGMTEKEAIGLPHSCIRHPDMPRAVFKLLWDTLAQEKEIFAYVINRAKSGNHYWVLAHVTPSRDASGTVVGYHSSRRVPNRKAVEQVIIPLYRKIRAIEEQNSDARAGMEASFKALVQAVVDTGKDYDELVFALESM